MNEVWAASDNLQHLTNEDVLLKSLYALEELVLANPQETAKEKYWTATQ